MVDTSIIVDTFVPSSGGVGFGMANLTITIIVGLTMMFLLWSYLKWNRERGNPYFMYELTKQHPHYVEIEYYKKLGNVMRLEGREKCPFGERGVYFRKLNKLLHIPQTFIVDGYKMRKIFFLITDTGIGAPLLINDVPNPQFPYTVDEIKSGEFNVEKLQSFIYEYNHWLKVARTNDEAYDLLLSQHIDTLYNEIQKKADDDKSWQERMMEAAPQFMLIGIIALSFLLNMYFVNDTLVKTNAQNVGIVSDVSQFYSNHLEQQVYCSLMISKYGSEYDFERWNDMIGKDAPPDR